MHRQDRKRLCFLLCMVILWPLWPAKAAEQRPFPKIGLVLSGGGARGVSHIGILKVFEQERIPIDCIAGTSFGALVGGLYSMGYSADEIEQFFIGQDWSGIFSNAPQRGLAPLIERRDARYQGQISFRGWSPELPTGLWEGQRLTEALALLATGPMLQAQDDFDRLPIQFRAVATNLVDGKMYIFNRGPMIDAFRASIAVPLLFTPLERDGMLLADGGLVNNLPTDIVRDMNADIIIAVDASSPLFEKDEIRTFFHVIDQSISLQMVKTVQENRELADILLQPDLEDYTNSDYGKLPEIIAQGEKEANLQLANLKALVAGIPFQPLPPRKSGSGNQVIDSLSFRGLEHIKPAQAKRHLRVHPGDSIDPEAINGDVGRLYGTRLFERVGYILEPIGENRYHLVYLVKEASHNTLGGSLRFDNTYEFVALAEFTARQLFDTPSSATLSTQFGGLENHSAALRFVPSFAPFLYIEPRVDARRQERLDLRDQVLSDTFMDKRERGQLTIGATFFRQLEISAGYRYERVTIEGGLQPNRMEASTNQAGLSFRLRRDSLNAQEFPSRGMNLRIKLDRLGSSFGGDVNYSRLLADYDQCIPFSERSTVRIQAAAGFSRDSMPFYDFFYIGGYSASEMASHQFLGLKRDELAPRQMLIAAAELRYQVFSRPLSFIKSGFLTGRYNGAYFSTRSESPYQFRFLNGGGFGLALDTMLGPVRAIVGWSEGGRFNCYVSIGPSF